MLKKTIKFILNRSEITAGTRGASLGPDAIITAARTMQSNFFGKYELESIADENGLLNQETNYPYAKRIDGYQKVYQAISDTLLRTSEEGKFPFILAGDHGSAAGTIAGIRRSNPGKRLGVIWIDAHGDIHSPYTTPSGNMHGMPLSLALGQDNLACQHNEVDADTKGIWDAMRKSDGIFPKLAAEDLVYIAVRDIEEEEIKLINRLNIRNFVVSEVERMGAANCALQALDLLSACDILYISFDVDSMDPDLSSYGTGTPVAEGLKPADAKEILLTLTKSEKLACVEFVEVNPCLDEKRNKMAEIAFDLIESIVTENLN